ncbi:MAG TPA: Ohr family peroxiredoxin [Dongiaceae bacterium]|nr:Ohr family peroxiredoxin [Dongiaceae bacterium]
MEPFYTAVAEVQGGRAGIARIAGREEELRVDPPASMGGSGKGYNPEQLFAVAYSACFGAAIDLEARQRGIALTRVTVEAHVSIGHGDGGHFALSVELHVRLPEIGMELGEQIMQAAHIACPYSQLARGDADVALILDESKAV